MLAVAVVFVVLTGAAGQHIYVNPLEVTTLRPPPLAAGLPGHWDPDVQCVVGMSNGRFFGVLESCATVDRMLEHGQ
jgi:hypothetical protein